MPPFAVLVLPLLAPSAPPRLDADGVPLPVEAVCRIGSARFRMAESSYGRILQSADGLTLLAIDDRDLVGWHAITGIPRFRTALAPKAYHTLTTPPDQTHVRVESITSDRRLVATNYDPASGHPLSPPQVVLPKVGYRTELSPKGSFAVELVEDVIRSDGNEGTDRVVVFRPIGVRPGPAVELTRDREQQPGVDSFFKPYAIAPDDRFVAVVTRSGAARVRLFDAKTGKLVRELPTDGANLRTVAFAPDGLSVVGWANRAGWDLMVWDVATGRRREPVLKADEGEMTLGYPAAPLFSRDGRRFVSRLTRTGVVRDAATGAVVRKFGTGDRIDAISADGRTVFMESDHVVVPIDVATGRGTASQDKPPDLRLVRFANDSRVFVRPTYGPRDQLTTWDAPTGRLVARGHQFPEPTDVIPYGRIDDVSPDGRTAVVLGRPGDHRQEFRLCDPATGTVRTTCTGHTKPVQRAVFTADGRFVLSVAKGEFRVWDATTGRQTGGGELPGFTQVAAVSADGRWLVCPSSTDTADELWVYDRTSPGSPARRFRAKIGGFTTFPVDLSADGRFVAIGGSRHFVNPVLRAWDVAAERLVCELPFPSGEGGCPGFSPRWSPDTRMIAVRFGSGGPIALVERVTGRIRRSFVGHRGDVTGLVFSPDGRYLAAASPDAPVLVWDVRGELSKPPALPGAAALASAWADLASADAAAGFRAVRLLAHFPETAVPFLRAKLAPATGPTPAAIAALVAALDAPAFGDREAAEKALKKLGELADPAVREELAGTASAEVRQRAGRLVAALDAGKPGPEQLRAVRAVEAVEWMGTPDAKALLAAWAGGAAGARLTTEAKAARR